ncbi:TSUP family transporter [Bacillus aerolatus]|uniref:Probable membrane transporter protein n=1 Tax=Bacillus aerolatus TaxID=2653354 RepID=A0A6I1FMS9_9BACI|nr:sulfite exporter TauE/SafE family protein [Bacillus aerolatus]KAB7707561.1 TSUP family transporter [Bacillus aerolatus]
MESFIPFAVIILFASILQTSTGFGFSIMATPFLLLLFEPKEAIQINLILSLVISCVLIRKIKKDTDMSLVKRFIVGSAAGLPVGMIIFLLADMNKLKLGISVIVLVLTLLLIFKFQIRQTKARDFTAGVLSGTLTTSIGMPGPPILLYFSSIHTGKEKLRATTLAFYLFIYSTSLLVQVLFAGTTKAIWLSSAAALPIVLAGLLLGQWLFTRINQRIFRIFLYGLLIFTGIYLLIDSLK